MIAYLADRIIRNTLSYSYVVSMKPGYKEELDAALKSLGYGNLIV